MPSKLRKAIGAVKDQTSISLAKVSNTTASHLEVLVLKATRHDEAPIDERYVNELLGLISSNKSYAADCAQAIARRIGKTRNWIVALKSLMLVLRIFQDGDPYFPREVFYSMKRGAKILNLSSFRDDSNSSPWDYAAFVRTFALYLHERLDCFLTGKLQRRFTNRERDNSHPRSRRNNLVCDMKPPMLLDKISHWQSLLDRAVATRPTGAAKTNRLVHISHYAVVKESFDLYRDISDGLALLLDSFFQLQYQSCAKVFQVCVKASKQFEELCNFYDLCKSIGVGRTSEYPSVQKISEELVETLQDFLKDQASFPTNGRSPPPLLLTAPPNKYPYLNSKRNEMRNQSWEPTERFSSERGSEFGLQCTSLEDLMSVTEVRTNPSTSMDWYFEQFEKQSQAETDLISANDSCSIHSFPSEKELSTRSSALDLVSLDCWPPEDPNPEREQEQEKERQPSELNNQTEGWEIVLAETAKQPIQAPPVTANNGFEPSTLTNFFYQDLINQENGFVAQSANNVTGQASLPEHHYNPFLQDTIEIPVITATTTNNHALFPHNDVFSVAPAFQAATPTFSARNPDGVAALCIEDDPFASCPATTFDSHQYNGSIDQKSLLQQQQLWLQHQKIIISKNMY